MSTSSKVAIAAWYDSKASGMYALVLCHVFAAAAAAAAADGRLK